MRTGPERHLSGAGEPRTAGRAATWAWGRLAEKTPQGPVVQGSVEQPQALHQGKGTEPAWWERVLDLALLGPEASPALVGSMAATWWLHYQ